MLPALAVESYEKSGGSLKYNRVVKLLLESTAVAEFTKILHAPKKDGQPRLLFMDWLASTPVKIIDIPEANQFWLKALAKN